MERLWWPHYGLPRTLERLISAAVEAMLTTAEIAFPSVDLDLDRKNRAATNAYEHDPIELRF